MKCNALPKLHVLAAPKACINAHACFQFASNQTRLYVMLMCWDVHFSGASTNHGLPSLMPIFAGNASLCSSCMF